MQNQQQSPLFDFNFADFESAHCKIYVYITRQYGPANISLVGLFPIWNYCYIMQQGRALSVDLSK